MTREKISSLLRRVRAAERELADASTALLRACEAACSVQVDCDLPRVRLIMDAVSAHYELPPGALTSRCRTQHYTEPRHLAIYLARQMTPHSIMEIARCFVRDPGSVVNSCQAVKARALERSQSPYRGTLAKLREQIADKLAVAAQ